MFYLIRQETVVDSSIYYDDAVDFKYEETKTYFPLKKMMRSEFYDSIEIHSDSDRRSHDEGLVSIFEISLGVNKVQIDDSYI